MKNTLLVRLGFIAAAASAWALLTLAQSQPTRGGNWYKGNLHTHTINSDGDSSPDAVARWYKEHRYQFLALTDHNYMTDPQGLNDFFAAKERFLLLAGEEVTSRVGDKAIHVNAWRVKSTIEPVFAADVVATLQGNVDAIRKAGAVPSLNHPNFRWSITPDELRQISNLKHFEVYNGHPGTHDAGGGGTPSLDEMWDLVLSAGSQIYGVAVDDAHHFKEFGPERSNPGRGWVTVRAPQLSADAIYAALESGDFYASNGVELQEMERSEGTIRLTIRQDGDFRYTTEFVGPSGKVLGMAHGLTAEYRLKPGERYARARVTDSGGRQAWMQPLFAN